MLLSFYSFYHCSFEPAPFHSSVHPSFHLLRILPSLHPVRVLHAPCHNTKIRVRGLLIFLQEPIHWQARAGGAPIPHDPDSRLRR